MIHRLHDIFKIEVFLTLLKIDYTGSLLGLRARLARYAARTPRDEFPQLRQKFIPWTPY